MQDDSLTSEMSNCMDCGAILLMWGSLGSRICFCQRQVILGAREKLNSLYYCGTLRVNGKHVDACCPSQIAINFSIPRTVGSKILSKICLIYIIATAE